jgi:hypothetical protein
MDRSANHEDITIYNSFFKDTWADKTGVYVEMGAWNGQQESNTRFFDECLGWDGLLVEANPVMYKDVIANRPNAHKMFFAPSCSLLDTRQNKTVQFHPMRFTNAGQEGAGSIYEGRGKMVDVPCGPLTPVLSDLFPDGRINFFSLDVESAEPFIVEHLTFKEVFIEVLMVESWNVMCKPWPAECSSRDAVRKMMRDAGYLGYANLVRKSDVFIHPNATVKPVKVDRRVTALW